MTTLPARRAAAIVAVMLLAAVVTSAQTTIRGRVVAVIDGDTITVLDAGRQQHQVYLNGIDAPETSQPYSQVSKTHLSELVFGKDVVVVGDTIDRGGRRVATVIVGTTNVNFEQLRAGFAWYYRPLAAEVSADNRLLYEAAEAEARAAKRGLWRDASPVAPWALRQSGAADASSARAIAATPTPSPRATTAGRVIGNRNSGIYHVPGCRSYNAVAERNRVYFNTEAEAAAAGYRKAQNCG